LYRRKYRWDAITGAKLYNAPKQGWMLDIATLPRNKSSNIKYRDIWVSEKGQEKTANRTALQKM